MKAPHITATGHPPVPGSSPLKERPRASVHLAESHPVCDLCGSDEYLVYERVRAVKKRKGVEPPLWDVDCWCGQCETFYGYRTTHPPQGTIHSTNPRPASRF